MFDRAAAPLWRLHRACYPRKPRGVGGARDATYEHRLSFCCATDGCRRRITPPSVRFLGRKVYLGVIVIVVSALEQGLSAARRGVYPEIVVKSPRSDSFGGVTQPPDKVGYRQRNPDTIDRTCHGDGRQPIRREPAIDNGHRLATNASVVIWTSACRLAD